MNPESILKGEPFFVEVKFRWHQEWHENDFIMTKQQNLVKIITLLPVTDYRLLIT